MELFLVQFIAPEPDDPFVLASPELIPMGFVFTDHDEAVRFRDHLIELYELDIPPIETTSPYTYDAAIQTVVEVIGPSPD